MSMAVQGWLRTAIHAEKSKIHRLLEGEVLCLSRSCPGVRVESGCVWITWKGKDIVLQQGEEFQFAVGQDEAVITTVLDYPSAIILIR